MDLSLTDEQRELVDAFAALCARESSADRVRAAEATGFDPRLWGALTELGVVPMAVGEDDGGWGASMLDLALVAEQLGRSVACAPVIDAQVAARLLAGSSTAWCAEALAGHRLVTFAPRPARRGVLTLVPAGAVADAVVALADDRLVVVPLGANRRPVDNLASLPLADITVSDDLEVLAQGHAAHVRFSRALDEWLTLTAAALCGLSARALQMGVDYAGQRHAFGAPIGSFQAVSHPLADSATATDGARLLALKAACAFADEPGRVAELAAMAFTFAYETARDTTQRSLHIHGGYGFGMEADIQLYYRRARGWGLVYGEPATALDRVAEARYGPVAG